ncbi:MULTISPECIES: phage tail assembly chaperone G [Bacillus]|uniref:Uncharacterized protein n=1 Tax=Bacillus velezensis TaxID=492670 RepID=A0A7W4LRX3_BACVE|nr:MULTISPECIES: hypothetical protein [Bacillus]AYV19457.1 hypothetical protein EEB07_19705 [Bacillus velezensis]MBW8603371.1 hypothetical protein [Bacillus amyloliquefaciens]MCT6681454.1 hypothetical protein [Bacillus velezensis]MEC0378905.1 hypothetical protein [Bacillus velezensis]MEC0447582.1 hypothetical protein [Bacillus velezensis]
MEALSITLRLDGKDKKFVTPDHITGLLFRKAAKITDDFESQDSERLFTDEQIEFVCNTFGQKFTPDEFEEGIDSRLAGRTIFAAAQYVLGNIADATALLNGEEIPSGEEPGE